MSIENSILSAIDTIVDRALETAAFDKTVRAYIVECVDESIGKYKVRYQDSLYYATSDNPSAKLSKNAEVYLLVPEGNFSNEKKILGTTKALGTDYINIVEQSAGFEHIGTNVITNKETIELCSYKSEEVSILNKVSIDNEALAEYLKEASHMILNIAI